MYRVLLIDDEAIILEGLKKVIHWEEFRCEIVGTAANGKQGTELIRETKPDILFLDICMPDGDGLTMLAGIRSEFPNLKVTILTGFRDFAFAQEAIRLGVTRFLLKPSKMNEIQEALQTMVDQLDEAAGTNADKAEEANDSEIGAAGNYIVSGAVNFIREHFAEKLTLQMVADSCFVSQWHLSKMLSKHMGKNFYDVLNETRISEAKRLLQDSSLRIGNIGEMVGYSDSAHFAKNFKKITGLSAAEYRNTLSPK